MNTIALIILFAIIFDFILNGIADYLNIKMLRNDLPEPFQGIYDPERYRKSQQYLKANTRFGWVSGTFDVIVILIFWFGRGFPRWMIGCDHLTTDLLLPVCHTWVS